MPTIEGKWVDEPKPEKPGFYKVKAIESDRIFGTIALFEPQLKLWRFADGDGDYGGSMMSVVEILEFVCDHEF